MLRVIHIALAAACCCTALKAAAAEREPVYTYLGSIVSGGVSRIVYTDWNTMYRNRIVSGYFVNGGITLWVMSKWLMGDFTLQYRYNAYKSEGELHHLYGTINGRIGIPLGSVAILAPGVGIYIESPPANKKFNGGAGIRVPLAFLFNLTSDMKIFIEGSFMYGWYGRGDRGEKMSYGGSLGFIFKVGRI